MAGAGDGRVAAERSPAALPARRVAAPGELGGCCAGTGWHRTVGRGRGESDRGRRPVRSGDDPGCSARHAAGGAGSLPRRLARVTLLGWAEMAARVDGHADHAGLRVVHGVRRRRWAADPRPELLCRSRVRLVASPRAGACATDPSAAGQPATGTSVPASAEEYQAAGVWAQRRDIAPAWAAGAPRR